MKLPKLVVPVCAAIIVAFAITAAMSSPPTPPPVGSVVPVAYNSASPLAFVADANGDLATVPGAGTLAPADGATPDNALGCTSAINNTTTDHPGLLLNIYFISPTNSGTGSTIEIFDEKSSPSCSSGGTHILYSSGQVGAGWVYHDAPIPFVHGISYQCTSCPTFGTGYGLRFRYI